MKSLGLIGPYRLDIEEVNDVLPSGWPGVYALGYLDHGDQFCITFVGGSYDDVARELIGRIGTANHFKACRCHSPVQAFEKLCELYHTFRPLGNHLHPERPRGEVWRCPVCAGHAAAQQGAGQRIDQSGLLRHAP